MSDQQGEAADLCGVGDGLFRGTKRMAVTGLDDVTVMHRDGTAALRQVTLLAEQGELLVVLGPSGSGKSTLLRAMAGLADVDSGEVLIGGQRVTRVATEKRNVAMVFESSALVPFIDVAHNLAWGLRARHVPKAEVGERVAAEARHLRLGRLLKRLPRSLSAGESELVSIGHALVRTPTVFLLDEPLAHLDTAERSRMRRRIVDLVRDLGVTTLYVTHDQADALAIADRVALLNDGVILQVDTPHNVYTRPANLFVAGFIGSPPIGLLPARLVTSAGITGFQVGVRTLPLWAPIPPELRDHVGRHVVLGLRAEDVHDATQGCDPALVTLTATVLSVEQTGREVIVALEVYAPRVTAPGADPSAAKAGRAQLRARFPRKTTLRPGSSVQVAVDVARAHVFDATTGDALRHPIE